MISKTVAPLVHSIVIIVKDKECARPEDAHQECGIKALECMNSAFPLSSAESGMFQVLFSMSQQELLSSLMMFGSAATVDALCHLNTWERCSIPIHSLKVEVVASFILCVVAHLVCCRCCVGRS